MQIPFTKQNILICLGWSLIGCAYSAGGGVGGYLLRITGNGLPRIPIWWKAVLWDEPVGFLAGIVLAILVGALLKFLGLAVFCRIPLVMIGVFSGALGAFLGIFAGRLAPVDSPIRILLAMSYWGIAGTLLSLTLSYCLLRFISFLASAEPDTAENIRKESVKSPSA